MRSDAQRNLDRIVAAAVEVIAERGVNAPMKAIADRAGVGIGTLYRRFPDQATLLSAVGRHYVESISGAVARAIETNGAAWPAIREFVCWVTDPGRGALAAALSELPEDALVDSEEFTQEQYRWIGQVQELVARAQSDGAMRADVNTDDIMALLTLFTCRPAALPVRIAEQRLKYVTLTLDGMQAVATTRDAD